MPKFACGKICVTRDAALQHRVEQKGFCKRDAEQFAVGKLRSLKCAFGHLHVGEVALFQRAVDERRAGKRAAGETAADKTAVSKRQPRVFATFQRKVFKENIFDILFFLAGDGKQSLNIVTRR